MIRLDKDTTSWLLETCLDIGQEAQMIKQTNKQTAQLFLCFDDSFRQMPDEKLLQQHEHFNQGNSQLLYHESTFCYHAKKIISLFRQNFI